MAATLTLTLTGGRVAEVVTLSWQLAKAATALTNAGAVVKLKLKLKVTKIFVTIEAKRYDMLVLAREQAAATVVGVVTV